LKTRPSENSLVHWTAIAPQSCPELAQG